MTTSALLGFTSPLGASYQTIDGKRGVNFALFSEHASLVELCLFDEKGNEERISMRNKHHVWHVFIFDIDENRPLQYGFRVHGVHNPQKGLYFNPYKLLLDPYAKSVTHKPHFNTTESTTLFDFNNTLDNGSIAPKAIITNELFDWGNDLRPRYSWQETIIYELHVKGFSQLNPQIPEQLRGTYAGLAYPASIKYLKNLGITTLELMPIAFHADELHLQQKGLRNYWGYNVLAPMAIEPDYAYNKEQALTEFKHMVKTLHQAGFEVILDVVFNHTADSDENCPTLSLRGIDNPNYYWLDQDNHYYNWTGCGNVLNTSQSHVQQWILDCLHYWVNVCHIDGFRFDLATVLGREPHFNHHATLFNLIANDPVLRDKKLIAEPWDMGWDGYQLGHFPHYFAEWNDRFRDDIRAFWLHHQGNMGLFAQRFCASSAIFKTNNKLPFTSVNYICSHDGNTLHDLVSYQEKYNWANGEDNHDGHNDNLNNNFGIEGETVNPDILTLRQAAKRALLATTLLAQGTPMLLAGDEFSNTQNGNNNAYCQDNETTWLNWQKQDSQLLDYVTTLLKLRRRINALTQTSSWWENQHVRWWNHQGERMNVEDWEDSDSTGFQIEIDQRWLLIINRTYTQQRFKLPEGKWRIEVYSPDLTVHQSIAITLQTGIYILFQ